jgi:hypothetical protein
MVAGLKCGHYIGKRRDGGRPEVWPLHWEAEGWWPV